MAKLKTQAAKDNLLRRVRKQRLNYIAILPSLITILNGVCGFASLVLASNNHFAKAGYVLLLAMIADMLDGRIARMSQNTSSFGGQLDSLCDIISFGVAPAFLMLKMLELKLAPAGVHLILANFLERFIWLVAAAYICCSAIRLARFNVENEEDESSHMSFIGLPTPAAAGVIVSLVIFTEFIQTLHQSQAYAAYRNVIIFILPFATFCSSLLMISRIRYPHIINQYIKGKKPFTHLIWVLLVIGLVIWSFQTALAMIFCGFAASGFLKWVYYKITHRQNNLSNEMALTNP